MFKPIFAIAMAGLLCTGCALTTAQIDVPYTPTGAAVAPVPGASAATVDVTATDQRTTYRDRVSTKKNGYGMEMAAIVSNNDIPSTVRDAFAQELTARGFKMGTGHGEVTVELVRFYSDFKTGIFSGSAVANVAFNVKVGSAAGSAFSKYYEGIGTNPNIMIMDGSEAQVALEKAFQASVNSAMSDPDFIKAVLAAGTEPGAAGKPAS